MVDFYTKRFLNHLPCEIYDQLELSVTDLEQIRRINKIQWLKWAVRCVREAVTTKVYASTGQVIHKKDDVLAFYKKNLPEKYDFVAELYSRKTDPAARKRLIDECLRDPDGSSTKFKALMPELEAVVEAIRCFHFPER